MAPPSAHQRTRPVHSALSVKGLAVETRGITKDYGNGRGIFDLDLSVPAGEVFGFLGPNGAGKTTTIRLLMGLIHATRGDARIFGLDCDRDSVAVKRTVGYCPAELPQFGGWRGSEVVAFVAGLRGDVKDAAITALAERLDLDLGRKYREYSHGNKQKLALVVAFMHRPELFLLDEPTSGLDPVTTTVIDRLIIRMKEELGVTSLVITHDMKSAYTVGSRIAMLYEGRIRQVGTVEEIQSSADPIVRQFIEGRAE